ncbi:Protein of unknown function [Cotesia congregata]|uniref:DUF4218 domain-containing protein n=1 Tax=Cotesia congregata TaxID=51543 RepID=A0A8J2ENC9_COTCN|nr:Protein of unknown function [Cotesia congregata]
MVEVARDLLNCFIRDFEQLYGLRYCSINIHLLIHLPDSVKNLGPLWAHTCYESEDLNGQLLKLLHGTWHIDSQLTRSQSQFITMARFIELSANENVRNFCQNKKVHSKILDQISDNYYSVGNYKCLDNEDIPLIIMLAMQRSELLMDNITIRLYFRLIKNNKVYVSKMYKDNMQTQSSVVQYLKNGQLRFGLIYCFIQWSRCICLQNICNCNINHHFANERQTTSFLCKCDEIIEAVAVDSLVTPCFYIKIQAQIYVAVPINNKERE